MYLLNDQLFGWSFEAIQSTRNAGPTVQRSITQNNKVTSLIDKVVELGAKESLEPLVVDECVKRINAAQQELN